MSSSSLLHRALLVASLSLSLPFASACGPKQTPVEPDERSDHPASDGVTGVVGGGSTDGHGIGANGPPTGEELDAGVGTEPITGEPTPPAADHTAAMGMFDSMCAGCHRGDQRKGPTIEAGYRSRDWIRGFLQDPSGDAFFGRTKIKKMKPVKQTGADLDALVEFVYAEGGSADADATLAATGRKLFDGSGKCSNCHAADADTEGEVGPNLGGHGTAATIAAFLANPESKRWFGGKNTMPSFASKLTAEQRDQVAAYIVSLRAAK